MVLTLLTPPFLKLSEAYSLRKKTRCLFYSICWFRYQCNGVVLNLWSYATKILSYMRILIIIQRIIHVTSPMPTGLHLFSILPVTQSHRAIEIVRPGTFVTKHSMVRAIISKARLKVNQSKLYGGDSKLSAYTTPINALVLSPTAISKGWFIEQTTYVDAGALHFWSVSFLLTKDFHNGLCFMSCIVSWQLPCDIGNGIIFRL